MCRECVENDNTKLHHSFHAQSGGATRSRRTKQLHWDKIRVKNTDGTVWSRESADVGDGFNREELENLFQVCMRVVVWELVPRQRTYC